MCHGCISQHRGAGKSLIVFSLLQELARRDGLTIAMSGLNEDELYPLLTFLSRNLTQPRFTPLLLDVCNMVTGELEDKSVISPSHTQSVISPSLPHTVCNLSLPPHTDIYGTVLSQSKTTMALFKVLKVKIDREVQFQKHAFQLLGSINTLLFNSINKFTIVP